MENSEEVLAELIRFGSATSERSENIPPLLDTYLQYVARSGDSVFPWQRVSPLLKAKLDRVIEAFIAEIPAEKVPSMPNVEPFQFNQQRIELHLAIDNMGGTPFTIQRLCELVTDPYRYYKRIDKYMRGVEKNVLVVSVIDPWKRSREVMNGDRDIDDTSSNTLHSNGSASSDSAVDHSSGDVTSSTSPSDDVYTSPRHSPSSELPGVDSVLNAMSDSNAVDNNLQNDNTSNNNSSSNNDDSSDSGVVNNINNRVPSTDSNALNNNNNSSSSNDIQSLPDSNESNNIDADLSTNVTSVTVASDPPGTVSASADVDNHDVSTKNDASDNRVDVELAELSGVDASSSHRPASFNDIDSTSSSLPTATAVPSPQPENVARSGFEPVSATASDDHDQCRSASSVDGDGKEEVVDPPLPIPSADVSTTVDTTSDLSIVAMDIECSAAVNNKESTTVDSVSPSENCPEDGAAEPSSVAPSEPTSGAQNEVDPSEEPLSADPGVVTDISVGSDMSLDDSLPADQTAQEEGEKEDAPGGEEERTDPGSMHVDDVSQASDEPAISTSSEIPNTDSMDIVEQSVVCSDNNSNNKID